MHRVRAKLAAPRAPVPPKRSRQRRRTPPSRPRSAAKPNYSEAGSIKGSIGV